MKFRLSELFFAVILSVALLFSLSFSGKNRAKKIDLDVVFIRNRITYGANLDNPKQDAPPVIATEILRKKYVCKYYDVATSGSDNGNNWIELRLADIYLLYSEAFVRTGGDKNTALLYLNKIRQRARNKPGDPSIQESANLLKDYQISDFSDDQDFLLAIEKERRVELAFENHRWFDLVRTGRAKCDDCGTSI
jgi:hypothetical protein